MIPFPFFSAIVLFENPIHFPRVFGGFIERSGSLGSEWKWKLPLEQCGPSFLFCVSLELRFGLELHGEFPPLEVSLRL